MKLKQILIKIKLGSMFALMICLLFFNCSSDNVIVQEGLVVEKVQDAEIDEDVEGTEEGKVFSLVDFSNPIKLNPGDDIQATIDLIRSSNDDKGGNILLGKGTYVLNKPLIVYSNINIHGYSANDPSGTVITIEDNTFNQPIITNVGSLYNVSYQNFKVLGNLLDSEQHLDPTYHEEGTAGEDESIRNNLIGILLVADGDTYREAKISNVKIRNVEVSNCAMGIHFKGAREVYLTHMNLHDNGMIEAYYHNLYFRRVFKFTISNSKMYNSPTGNGMNVSQSEDVTIRSNECYSNFFRGLRVEGEQGFIINKINITQNACTDNGVFGIRLRNITSGLVNGNTSIDNGTDTDFENTNDLVFTNNSWQ
ncbi:right-handed parallel beta-helix repeat-containing protein [Algibacter mikhailovii]|uniref:right-handed parallel beta-helix repeat-containing protein n=1 Tax=Algibacter mikhailovii TaxID=425498 RepID=UPI002494F5CB|nr:right-handed parallel beta-helix repeat-containing protein [Algibacter mikhailovii]